MGADMDALNRNVKYAELSDKLWKELRVMEPLDSWYAFICSGEEFIANV